MISTLAVVSIGLILGMRHAMDPDHVVAVTTIVSRQRSILKAGLIGIFWGVGHTVTIFLIGTAIILFNVTIPARVGLAMELSVGAMLVLLGGLNLSGVTGRLTERLTPAIALAVVEPDSSGRSLLSAPVRQSFTGRLERCVQGMGKYQALRPLGVGIVHGMAGSAAIALLLMSTIRDPWWAAIYLLVFGAGTIVGMMLITALVAIPFAYTTERIAWLNRSLTVASGVLSLGFGFFIAYHIGFVDGLFTSHPHWIPR